MHLNDKTRPIRLDDGTQLEIRVVPGGWQIAKFAGTSTSAEKLRELIRTTSPVIPREVTLQKLVVSLRTRNQPSYPGRLNPGEVMFVWLPKPGRPSEKLIEAKVTFAGPGHRV